MTDINHVGVTVGDIDAAVRWYTSVLGLELLAGPMHCDTTTTGAGRRADVFGTRWGAMKLAHLGTSNGGGVELFQFIDPPVREPDDNFAYWRIGPHHIALTVPDFDGTIERIVSSGGKQRTAVHDVHSGSLVCYCEDPWGNIVEIVSTSYRALSTATTK
ncbi:VOC family protein [Saccharopolyspora spinosa]|uniref:Catechol 2,3-dioxygenase-like lactoylglutathione lyase family enzyme n=1 Tax=Saccharopolyspora spinosa TaxID=60894 RepID=A0A2N3Y6S9_SACSN|nr:VOC family protein [Saccharopolyspora spinosa]PKW18575.1 catechol 2,3-dioxygenase-like lactoylglutathione lyase family enzyme [Saccharopolyspora spinosa]